MGTNGRFCPYHRKGGSWCPLECGTSPETLRWDGCPRPLSVVTSPKHWGGGMMPWCTRCLERCKGAMDDDEFRVLQCPGLVVLSMRCLQTYAMSRSLCNHKILYVLLFCFIFRLVFMADWERWWWYTWDPCQNISKVSLGIVWCAL